MRDDIHSIFSYKWVDGRGLVLDCMAIAARETQIDLETLTTPQIWRCANETADWWKEVVNRQIDVSLVNYDRSTSKNAAPAPTRPLSTLRKVTYLASRSEIEVKISVSVHQQANKGKVHTSCLIGAISLLWMDCVLICMKMCDYSLFRKIMKKS